MANSAIIKIQGIDYAKVYKHFDGNPESTLPWLKTFNSTFAGYNDPHYKFAQLLRSSILDSRTFQLDDSRVTGWGVYSYDESCGEQFEYTLQSNGDVTYKNKCHEN